MADRALTFLKWLNRRIAVLVGMGLLACAGFVLLDVILREFGTSFGGTDEISGYAMAIAAAWGMGFTMLELGHVRIDVLRAWGPRPVRVLFDLVAMIALAGTTTIIAVQCWPVVENSLRNMSRANTPLETPLWAVQVPWFVGWTWFALMAWCTLIIALILIIQGRFQHTERVIGIFATEEDRA